MEDRIALLQYSTRKGVPSDYVTYDVAGGAYASYKEIVARQHKRPLRPNQARESLAALVLEQASARFERRSLFPLFALWFAYHTDPATGDASDEMLAAAYAAAVDQEPYKDESKVEGTRTQLAYGERVVRPYLTQERELLRADREHLATLSAQAELSALAVDDKVRALAHDLEISEASSSFTTLERPPVAQLFERLELDALLPFAALIYKRSDGTIDARYRMYTASAKADISRWFEAVRSRIDPAREATDRDVPPELHALVLYNQVLRNELEASARPGERVDDEEADAEEEEEAEEEEQLRSVAVERRPARERERSFTRLTYDGRRFVLKVPADVIDPKSTQVLERFLFRRLQTHGTPKTDLVSVKASFAVFDVAIVPELLLHLISTDERFSAIFYIIELQKSYAEKDRLTLHYETSPDKHVMISFSKLEHAKITDVFRKDGRIVGYNGRRYFTVKMSKATDHSVATTAYAMLLRLFDAYVQQEPALVALYRRFFPAVDLAPPPLTTKEKPLKPVELCKLVAPTIFRRQGRSMQTKSQVTCIATDVELSPPPEDVARDPEGTELRRQKAQARLEEFLGRAHPKRGVSYAVLHYQGVYFTSESAEKPFLGFKQKDSTRNVKVPSCYVSRPTNVVETSARVGGVDIRVFEELPTKKKSSARSRPPGSAKTAKPITTLKILNPGLIGVLTSPISTLLTRYVGSDKIYVRFGVPYTANALLHCACAALELRPYLKADDREAFVWNVRRAELVRYAAATRQEQHDLSTEEVRQELLGTGWLDPRRYYRAVEEWMLARDEQDSGRRRAKPYRVFMLETTEGLGMRAVVPRHALFHARDYHEAATVVLLFVHVGQECNNATHEQVELVVSRTKKARAPEVAYTFDSPELLTTLQTQLLDSTIVRRVELVEHLGEAAQSIVSDSHDVPSAHALFAPLRVVGQQLDSFGKLRAVRLAGRDDPSRTVVLLTPPLAPLGLAEGGVAGAAVPEEELRASRAPLRQAAELLGRIRQLARAGAAARATLSSAGHPRPALVASVEAGRVRALHCYVAALVDPCTALVVPEAVPSSLEAVSGVPHVDPRGDSELEKLQRLKRALPRVLAHLDAAYSAELDAAAALGEDRPSGERVVARWCVVRPRYDYRGEAVVGERAVLDSERMARWAERYVDAFLAVGLALPPSTLAPPAEPVGRRVTYVPSTEMLKEWHDYIVLADPAVHEELDLDALAGTYHPYFLRLDDELLLLQSTRRNDKAAALACAYNWITSKVNTGFYTLPADKLEVEAVGEASSLPTAAERGGAVAEVLTFRASPNKELRVLRFERPNLGIVVGDAPREFWCAVLAVGTI